MSHSQSQRVAITGASGTIGSALSTFLSTRGDDVVHLVRREPRTRHEVRWDPASRKLDPGDLSGLTAVVHLAGAGVGDHRWTPAYKQEILASRVNGTATIASALVELRALAHLIDQDLAGPVNLVGTQPLRQAEVMKALGAQLGRSAVLPTPALALKVALGEFADDILASARILPSILTASGFVFEHDTIELSLIHISEPTRQAESSYAV